MTVDSRWARYAAWSGIAGACLLATSQGAACATTTDNKLGGGAHGGDAGDENTLFPEGPGEAGGGATGDGGNCLAAPFKTTVVPMDMMIALDRSGSTAESNIGKTVVTAIKEVTKKTADHVHWGLTLYPSRETCAAGAPNCILPSGPSVLIGVDNAPEKISTVFSKIMRCGSTPTADTLRVISKYMKTVDHTCKKSVLLATDGAPNCNGSLDPATCVTSRPDGAPAGNKNVCLDDQGAIAAAKELKDAGYPVYVMGMGIDVKFENIMNQIAVAGGTEQFYPVTDVSQLVSTLETITGAAITCEFTANWEELEQNVSRNPGLVNVYHEAANEVVYYSADCSTRTGWTWTDAGKDTIRLCPEACQKAKKMEWSNIHATFGCTTLSIR